MLTAVAFLAAAFFACAAVALGVRLRRTVAESCDEYNALVLDYARLKAEAAASRAAVDRLRTAMHVRCRDAANVIKPWLIHDDTAHGRAFPELKLKMENVLAELQRAQDE
ncbi:MAG TPA: hypothetical protein VMI11_06340 [Actinomycetes bacterium]|nr:hypothetical protein [Actinomycetes bacterium]